MAEPGGGAQRATSKDDLLAALPDMIFRVSGDEIFLEFHGGEQDLALPPEQFLGRKVREVIPGPVAELLLAAAVRARATKQLQVAEYELPPASGHFFEARVVTASHGDSLFVIRNITEGRKAETALRQATVLLEAVASVQAEFISGTAPEVFDRMLALALRLTGSAFGVVGEVVPGPDGRPSLHVHALTDIAWDEPTRSYLREHADRGLDFANLDSLLGAALVTGTAVVANDPAHDPRSAGLPSGHPRLHAFLGAPLLYAGRLVGMIGVANRPGGYDDALTAWLDPFFNACASLIEARRAETRRRAAELERAELERRLTLTDRLSSLGTLAAGMAHEINNPLAFVGANLELVAEALRAPELPPLAAAGALEAVEDARVGADRIRRIVQGLQAFAAPDRRARVTLTLPSVVEKAAALVMNEIRHRARFVREDAGAPAVHADEGGLTQLLVNLLLNAAQAIAPGCEAANEIRVVTRTEGGRAVLEVRDTGEGIPPAHLERIFDPFFSTRGPGVGTGLGLSICHAIATAHGGDLSVESSPGTGTVVRLRLPPAEAPRVTPEPMGAAEAPSRSRVLVIDDEPLVLATTARVLQSEFETEALGDAREALARIGAGVRYGAILCDLMMPNMTGMAFYQALCQVAPELAARCAFLTGGAFTDDARRFLETVPGRTVEKPFDVSALRDLVRRLASS